MSVLIVGGAGYIGSHVNNFFIEQNVDTVILDDLTNGNAEAISRASGFYIGIIEIKIFCVRFFLKTI
jgi:UDP-glucose 4-epimerase